MKLVLLFVLMDLLTLLAYPIVFMHGKLRQFLTAIENTKLANVWVTGSATLARQQIEIV
jgi:hypothetical protein